MEVDLNAALGDTTSSKEFGREVNTKKTKYFSLSVHSSFAPTYSSLLLMPVCLILT